jgi:hypothetical protein
MNEDQQQLIIADNNHKFFHILLNMWEDTLGPHQYRLIGHYARVAGEKGSCWEGVRKTCEKLGMGHTKLIDTRDELARKGYLRVYKPVEEDYESSVVVEVVYDWETNFARYAPQGGVPNWEHPVTGRELPRSQPGTKEDSSKKNQEEDSKSQSPVSSPSQTSRRKLNRGDFDPSDAEKSKPSMAEQRVDNPGNIPVRELSNLERFILSVVPKRIKTIADTYRIGFADEVVWYYEGIEYRSPSPNELWDTNPLYQRFVKERLMPKMQKVGYLTPVLFYQWLPTQGNYIWFFVDYHPGEVKTPQDVQAADDAALRAARCGYENKSKKARVMNPASSYPPNKSKMQDNCINSV